MVPSDQWAITIMPVVWPTCSELVDWSMVRPVRAAAVARTVMAAVRDTPPRLAVMVAVPAATAVTTPPAFTVATEGAELIQVR